MTRTETMASLRSRRAAGKAIVVAGVGSGLTAAGAVAGGADLLACYGTAAYRILGVPTALAFLPYDDANVLTLDLLPPVVGRAGAVPVIAGLGAHDPRRPLEWLVDAAAATGAAGITNEPFCGIYGQALRDELESAGYGFGREVALLEVAARRGLLTLGWAFDAAEARRLADAGVDIIGAMAGITGRPAGGESEAGPGRSIGRRHQRARGDGRGRPRLRVGCDRPPPRRPALGRRLGRGRPARDRGRWLRDRIQRGADPGPRRRPRCGGLVPGPGDSPGRVAAPAPGPSISAAPAPARRRRRPAGPRRRSGSRPRGRRRPGASRRPVPPGRPCLR